MKCSWCDEDATTQVNLTIRKGRLQLVDVCPAHARTIERAHEQRAAEVEAKKKRRR